LTDPDRAARKSDLFGRDPEFAPEDEGAPPPPIPGYFGHDHAAVSDCAYCPICATIGLVRNAKPEVLEHLANAARELILAAGMIVEEAGKVVGAQAAPAKPAQEEEPPSNVRHLDIS
jgi:hypothetical protein